jgi:hypothetical protein
MDETELVDSFDSENAFRHVEAGNVLRKCVVLDEHGHEIAAGEEFHD